MTAPTFRERLRAQLADLKMPGALEALDDILRRADSGELAAGEAMAALLGSHIAVRNQRRLQTVMRAAQRRSSRSSSCCASSCAYRIHRTTTD